MKDKHTGGKWAVRVYNEKERCVDITVQGQEHICDLNPLRQDAVINAERIVACVNALNGISNESLSSGVVGEMVELLEQMRDYSVIDTMHHEGEYNDLIAILSKLEADDG